MQYLLTWTFYFVGQNKHSNISTAANQAPQEENIMGLLQKADEVSSVPNENNYASSRKQAASEQAEQKVMYVDLLINHPKYLFFILISYIKLLI